jgi:hypothetical protein
MKLVPGFNPLDTNMQQKFSCTKAWTGYLICGQHVTEHSQSATFGHFTTGHPGGERGEYARLDGRTQARPRKQFPPSHLIAP